MRSLVIVAVLLLVCPIPAHAQDGYIGLYTDESHSGSCSTGQGFYPVEIWICLLPFGYYGQFCAEFAIQYPDNVIRSTVTENLSLISVQLGDLSSGVSVCYVDCQYSWYWLFHQTVYVVNEIPAWIEIIKHPEYDYGMDCPVFSPCGYQRSAPG